LVSRSLRYVASLRTPARAHGSFPKGEPAEIFVVEVDLVALSHDLAAHESYREPVMTRGDHQLEAVLERLPDLETSSQLLCRFAGVGPPLGAISGIVAVGTDPVEAVLAPEADVPWLQPRGLRTETSATATRGLCGQRGPVSTVACIAEFYAARDQRTSVRTSHVC
jgi:hypothetical protein